MIRTQAYNEALFTNNIGLSTVDINFNYLAFLSTTQVLNELSNLGSVPAEIDRILIDDTNLSYVNSVFKFDFTIDSAEVVCAISEIMAKDSTSTIITLHSSTSGSFEVNNLIEVETSEGFIESSIFAKTGDDITIQAPINALVSGLVRKKVSHIAILCNATSTPNPTDLIHSFFARKFYKDSTADRHQILQYKARGI